MDEIWTKDLLKPQFPALQGDVNTDVLIIGGGMAGILCALRLQQAGVECLLVEGKSIGLGITKGTTAVLSAQRDKRYAQWLSPLGKQNTKRYLNANLRAVEEFAELSRQYPCDFSRADAYLYSLHDKKAMEQEVKALRAFGFDASFCDTLPIALPIAGAVRYPNMGQMHPLKLLYQLAQRLPVFEHTFVQQLDGTTAVTQRGKIHAKRVIVATHFPFLNRHGMYFLKQYQARSYVIAYENAPEIGCTLDSDTADGFYLRNYGKYLIVGGGEHRTGKKSRGFAPVEAFAKQYFPEATPVARWANQDCMSLDGLPYVGAYSPNLPNVYVATGFGGWGMTGSMVAARVLTDLLCGRNNPLASILDPARTMAIGQLLANLGQTLVNFLTPTTPRCPHLGCALKWNRHEHSWDCPCHGSRFTAEGKLLNNPATKDAK